jgi:hypothetical protein
MLGQNTCLGFIVPLADFVVGNLSVWAMNPIFQNPK